MAAGSQWVFDVTAATFEKEVIEKSMTVPVVLDFWAEWCGPCRQLAPMLESLAAQYDGKFLLGKVDIEAEQDLAAAFRIESIPMVVAFQNGQPVDHFMGVLSEPELKEWLGRILPSPEQQLLQEAMAVMATDPQQAETKLRQALELDEKNDGLRIELARSLLAQNRLDECRALMTQLEARGYLEPEAEKLKSELDLRETADEAGGVEEARKALAAQPDDPTLKLHLADALAVSGKHEEALELCLSIVRETKTGPGEEAKTTMVKIFDMLGPTSELAMVYRRKLATLLY